MNAPSIPTPHNTRNRTLPLLAVALAALAIAAPARAQASKSWTTVGAAGNVDDGDTAIFDGLVSAMGVKSTAPLPATVDVKYNVTAVDGLLTSAPSRALRVGLLDDGSGSRVVVRLKRASVSSGAVTTIATLDSDAWSSSPYMQVREHVTCYGEPTYLAFDFSLYAYFFEVQITKSTSTANPRLYSIQLVERPIC